MNSYARTLKDVILNMNMSQAEFAKHTKVSHALISRYLSGKVSPDKLSLSKICQKIPPPSAVSLITAYLDDHTPRAYKKNISIIGNSPIISEKELMLSTYSKLPPDCQSAIAIIARATADRPEIRDWITKTAELLN